MLLVLALAGYGRGQEAEAQVQRVLLLNSYHPQYEWTERLVDGVREELSEVVPAENLHVEFMDARRFVDDEVYQETLFEFLKHKAAKYPPQVVLSSDDGALRFLLRHRDDLYPGVPVVFCGVNVFEPEMLKGHAGYTGILEGMEVVGNLRLIADVQPEVSRIVMLADRTSFGARMGTRAKEVMGELAKEPRYAHLEFELWDDFTLPELYRRVGGLGPETAVLLLAIHKDANGRYFSFARDLPELTAACPVPVYGMWGALILGRGALGGLLNDPELHGRNAAALARRVLAGESADGIPIVEKAVYRPFFDHGALERFSIGEGRLPEGSVVAFRPVSFYSENKALVWAATGVVGLLMIIIIHLLADARHRRAAERERAALAEQLQQSQKMEALGRLAGGVAHDFNNLLTVILGNAEIRATEGRHAASDAALAEITEAANRAAGLTRKLLAFSRQQVVRPTVVDLADVVRNLEGLLKRLVRENIELSLEVRGQGFPVLADPSQLEQILMNLVVNSVDAIPESGAIAIRVEHAGLLQDLVHPGQREYVRMSVEDSGVGIDEASKERIFEPFYTTKPVGKGTGLGLSTIYGVVEQLGGRIRVDSAPTRGTTVEVLVPVTQGRPEEGTVEGQRPSPKGGLRILLCEDEPDVRRVVSGILRSHGHEVLECGDADQAEERADGVLGTIDLLLTDVVMPGRSGRDLADALVLERPELRVLLMSGYPSDALGKPAARYEFLAKPFRSEELMAAVERAVGPAAAALSPGS